LKIVQQQAEELGYLKSQNA